MITDSKSFSMLHEKVRGWAIGRKWQTLRDVQEESIPVVLEGHDIVISAATAAGKTEAAFLPICSRLLQPGHPWRCVLYISPLKALINDQYERLSALCHSLDIRVTRWHGDVPAEQKLPFLKKPGGILLITPESLESLFIRHGPKLPYVFGKLDYVVIDEFHYFIGRERGVQLHSQLARLESATESRPPRIALSATIGDTSAAAAALRPQHPDSVKIISTAPAFSEIDVRILGFLVEKQDLHKSKKDKKRSDLPSYIRYHTALYNDLVGGCNLLFANSPKQVEIYSDILRRICEARGERQQFFPHHGMLSKELREAVEAALKDKSLPITTICTSTLELGIDIGEVKKIGLVEPPAAVSSLKQRLGRSGRRGTPPVLRMYALEYEPCVHTDIKKDLREKLVRFTALTQLLLRGWCEPPDPGGMHLSTLAQQTLSCIAHRDGVTSNSLWELLHDRGPFGAVPRPIFDDLLSCLESGGLILHKSGGLMQLTRHGASLVDSIDFLAAFKEDYYYTIMYGNSEIGKLPRPDGYRLSDVIIFAGLRWVISEICDKTETVYVQPCPDAAPIEHLQKWIPIHDEVSLEMYRIYTGTGTIPFLDTTASTLLEEARATFALCNLGQTPLIQVQLYTLLFHWRGSKIENTIIALLCMQGFDQYDFTEYSIYIRIHNTTPGEVYGLIKAILEHEMPDGETLARIHRVESDEKFDYLLSENLRHQSYASSHYDIPGAFETLAEIIARADASGNIYPRYNPPHYHSDEPQTEPAEPMKKPEHTSIIPVKPSLTDFVKTKFGRFFTP